MSFELFITLIGLVASISSITFAYLAFKKSEKQESKKEGKNEGLIISEISYVKVCVERMERALTKLDERYKNVLERLSKAEEALSNVTKRVDEIYKKEGG